MKIVIDIEEGRYNWIMSHASNDAGDYDNAEDLFFRKAVESGTILPKGHGDLIDRNVAYDVLDNADLSLNCSGLLKYIPTVIPADKGE